MRLPTISLGLALIFATAALSPASVRSFGKESQKSPLWSGALEELVNLPERVAGEAWYGRTDFYFEGNSAAINQVMTRYAKLEAPHIYVTTEPGEHRAVLQIQHLGDVREYLTINVHNEDELKELKLPADVAVEALRPVGEWIDPDRKAMQQKLWEEIKAHVLRHEDRRRESKKSGEE